MNGGGGRPRNVGDRLFGGIVHDPEQSGQNGQGHERHDAAAEYTQDQQQSDAGRDCDDLVSVLRGVHQNIVRQERKVMGEIVADVIGQQQSQNIGDGTAGDDGNEHFCQKTPERQQEQAEERKDEKSETGEQDFGLDFVVQDHRVFVRV